MAIPALAPSRSTSPSLPPPPNGVVGVAGQIAGPTHDFVITSIPQDPDNDGFINTQSVEFIGYVERTNRGDFTDTHGTLTIEAIENGTVIGTVDFNTADFSQDPMKPYRANFRLPATLLSNTSTQQDVVFRVISSTHGPLDANYSADTTQLLTAKLVVDQTGPTITQVGPLADDRLRLRLHGRCHILRSRSTRPPSTAPTSPSPSVATPSPLEATSV